MKKETTNTMVMVATENAIAELTNADLKKSCKAIVKARTAQLKNSWEEAKEYYNIVTEGTYEDDFETDKEFAGFMGISNSKLTQCKKAVEFIAKHEDIKPVSVAKAYYMGTLTDEQFADFIQYCTENDIDYSAMGDNALQALVKKFKNVVDTEATEEPEEATEETTETTPDEDIPESLSEVTITMYGIEYRVPADIANEIMSKIANYKVD